MKAVNLSPLSPDSFSDRSPAHSSKLKCRAIGKGLLKLMTGKTHVPHDPCAHEVGKQEARDVTREKKEKELIYNNYEQ